MTGGLESAPIVARVVRSGFVESVHHGLVVVTARDGRVARAWGDPATAIMPRSALKPLQALAALRAGAPLSGPGLALACASHSGEVRHLDGVREVLAASGLTPDALRNTPGRPIGEAPLAAWLAAGRADGRLAHNCSGKHAAMLVACRAAGWSLGDYLDAGHPLQRLVVATIEEVAGAPVAAVGVDGCGAPAPAIPLEALARAFGRLAAAPSGPGRAVADALRAHPDLVGGTGRPDTDLMSGAPGLIAKEGAEAVFAVGLPDGRGVAVKVADGARAARVVMAAALRALEGAPDAALDRLGDVPVLGHGRPVGRVEPALPTASASGGT